MFCQAHLKLKKMNFRSYRSSFRRATRESNLRNYEILIIEAIITKYLWVWVVFFSDIIWPSTFFSTVLIFIYIQHHNNPNTSMNKFFFFLINDIDAYEDKLTNSASMPMNTDTIRGWSEEDGKFSRANCRVVNFIIRSEACFTFRLNDAWNSAFTSRALYVLR